MSYIAKMKYLIVVVAIAVGFGLVRIGLGLAQGDTPRDGAWSGDLIFMVNDVEYQAELQFVVEDGAVVEGEAKLVFTYATISGELMGYMLDNGCVVSFDKLEETGQPIRGFFSSAIAARGSFELDGCYLDPYGDLTFVVPLQGSWSASWASEDTLNLAQPVAANPTVAPVETTAATIAPTIAPTIASTTIAADTTTASSDAGNAEESPFGEFTREQMEAMYQVFIYECSECHGEDAEGSGSAPTLITRQFQRKSVEAVREILIYGVPGTEMQTFGYLLSEDEQTQIIYLLQHWETVVPILLEEQ